MDDTLQQTGVLAQRRLVVYSHLASDANDETE